MVETAPRMPWWLCHSPRRSWGCHGKGLLPWHTQSLGWFLWSSQSFRQGLPSQVSGQGDFSIQGGVALSSAVFPCPEQGSGGAGEVISVPGLHPTAFKGGPCQQVFFQNTCWCWVGAWTQWSERFIFNLRGSMTLTECQTGTALSNQIEGSLYTCVFHLHFGTVKKDSLSWVELLG